MNERIDRPRQYSCCACRTKLPQHHRGYSHKECLRQDKRRRTREKREQERKRFEALRRRSKCFTCGDAFAEPVLCRTVRVHAKRGKRMCQRWLAWSLTPIVKLHRKMGFAVGLNAPE